MIGEQMKQHALAEFDAMAAREERRLTAELSERGYNRKAIRHILEANRPNVEAQRATIGSIVTVALLKAGVSPTTILPWEPTDELA